MKFVNPSAKQWASTLVAPRETRSVEFSIDTSKGRLAVKAEVAVGHDGKPSMQSMTHDGGPLLSKDDRRKIAATAHELAAKQHPEFFAGKGGGGDERDRDELGRFT